MATEFTPFTSLLGGMLIGLSVVFYMVFNGQIAGISGILARILPPVKPSNGMFEAIAFVLGLLVALPIYLFFSDQAPGFQVNGGLLLYAIAGVIVGVGTTLGSGCTSGHGVCGISRLSTRSIIATITFMFTGVITVFLLRHVIGG